MEPKEWAKRGEKPVCVLCDVLALGEIKKKKKNSPMNLLQSIFDVVCFFFTFYFTCYINRAMKQSQCFTAGYNAVLNTCHVVRLWNEILFSMAESCGRIEESQPEDWNCSVVRWYSSGYLCIARRQQNNWIIPELLGNADNFSFCSTKLLLSSRWIH